MSEMYPEGMDDGAMEFKAPVEANEAMNSEWGDFKTGDRVIYGGKQAWVVDAEPSKVPEGMVPVRMNLGFSSSEVAYADPAELKKLPDQIG